MLWLYLAKLVLVPVAEGFPQPTEFVPHPQDSSRAYVLSRLGKIFEVNLRKGTVHLWLDLGAFLTTRGPEQGLLGMAFSPHGPEIFVNYTDTLGHTVIARIPLKKDHPDLSRIETVLRIPQPAPNHNGGCLRFGPDGMLYGATGDGGRAGDPWGNAQNTHSLLGKILRLDIRAHPYAIPPDNPFALNPEQGRPEIWLWGLRNPWKFSFDRKTGDLWIADVGQDRFEEVNVIPTGQGGLNLGWNLMEGKHPYRPRGALPRDLVPPVWEYDHTEGCSITGGFVYRGHAIPSLVGWYVFGDFCSGVIWGYHPDSGRAFRLLETGLNLSSFGEDLAGEIYVLDYTTGRLFRLQEGGLSGPRKNPVR